MLTTSHFLWTARVQTPLELDESAGSALRGHLFEALWNRFCTNQRAPSCAACELHTLCPVSTLLAPQHEESSRGRDIPRPYILLPPLGTVRCYEPGQQFIFGMTLFGKSVELLPYLILCARDLEALGLGHRLAQNGGRRGTFRIQRIEAYHPLSGARQDLYRVGQMLVKVPTLTVTEEEVRAQAQHLPTDRLTLALLTPVRLITANGLTHRADFRTLIERLIDRLERLAQAYGEPHRAVWLASERRRLLDLATAIRCEEDATRWQDVTSYSRRLRRTTPIGGLLGRATFVGDLAPFRELLVWGELIHVGKSTVKGDGWYRIVKPGSPEALMAL